MAKPKTVDVDPLESLRANPSRVKELVLNPETFKPFADVPEEIFECTNLERLEIWDALDKKSSGRVPPAIGKLRKLLSLKLSGVRSIPAEIGKCTALRELMIRDAHELAEVPASIASLTNLTLLYLSGGGESGTSGPNSTSKRGRLKKLPDSFGKMTKLRRLVLPAVVREVPSSVWQLKELRDLELPESATKLPAGIKKLTKLETITLSASALSSVAKELAMLKSLKNIVLVGASKTLPSEIGELVHLQSLYAVGVGLEKLPETFAHLKSLEVLAVGSNRLTHLSSLLAHLPKLTSAHFPGNKLPKAEEALLKTMMNASPKDRPKMLLPKATPKPKPKPKPKKRG